jgi:hypothetical protein
MKTRASSSRWRRHPPVSDGKIVPRHDGAGHRGTYL